MKVEEIARIEEAIIPPVRKWVAVLISLSDQLSIESFVL
jgi:hypothetical protein